MRRARFPLLPPAIDIPTTAIVDDELAVYSNNKRQSDNAKKNKVGIRPHTKIARRRRARVGSGSQKTLVFGGGVARAAP